MERRASTSSTSSTKVPERIAWAVELVDPHLDERILELGCGPGVALALVGDRLDQGRITGIDRSAVAVERSRARNTQHIAAGRVVVEQAALADLDLPPDHFDKAFAVNVNVFWTGTADAESRVLARVLRPGGVLHLVYGGPGPDGPRDVAPTITANLERHGFVTTVTRSPDGGLLCVTGRPPDG